MVNFEIRAPQDGPPLEQAMHNFLDSIDVQLVNVGEYYKAEEKEAMLNSRKLNKSVREMRYERSNSKLWENIQKKNSLNDGASSGFTGPVGVEGNLSPVISLDVLRKSST